MSKDTQQLETNKSEKQKPLHLLPGVILVFIQWLARFGIPLVYPDDLVITIGVLLSLLCGLGVFIWWAFFSRAPRIDRWGGLILMIAVLIITSLLVDHSIATGGQGMMFFILAIPILSLAFVVWAIMTRNLSANRRRWSMVATVVIACGVWLLFRNEGITGDFGTDLSWRWSPTPEEELLAMESTVPLPDMNTTASENLIAEWPGFRGPDRDAVIRGVRIATNWDESPPVELWRRPIGPGCSSFAVQGDLLFTQEQRGEFEVVSCYNLRDGSPIWQHRDKARFYDSHAGAGPRSTPTLENGLVYSLGATGVLNALDSKDGSLLWSRNAADDADVKPPAWGFAGSPLIVDTTVIIALSGKLAAYDTRTGESRWFGPNGGHSYSSPQLLTINGIPQVLQMSKTGAISVNAETGNKYWQYDWPGDAPILQPALVENDLMFAVEYSGIHKFAVSRSGEDWKMKKQWTSNDMKLNFNDFVIHKGHAYGFHGPNIACLSIADGNRKWKGKRYRGFTLLLADQDLLLVLSEKGELALVAADPNQFRELSKIQAIKGRTWNHPAIAGNIVIVRNAEEMAAFRLPPRNE
jgi:outer membrane protein assembly factor BamB